MSPRPTVLGVCLSVAVTAAILAAQEQTAAPRQPTFRTAVQSVRVDLYATRDGKPVTDLRRDEIQLFEDGVPQAIQTFEPIAVAPHTAARPADPHTLDQSRQLATDPRARLFVVFVPLRSGSAFSASVMQARIPVIRQLNNLLGPNDLIAVVTPDTRISELTFQRRLPVSGSAWFDEPEDPRHALWDVCYPSWLPGSPNSEMKARYRELMTFETLDALIAHLGGLRDERKHVLMLSEGFRLYTRNENLGAAVRAAGGAPGTAIDTSRPGDSLNPMISTRQCESDLIDLGSLDHARRLDQIAAHARRNNVSFYPISPPAPSAPPTRRTFGGMGGGAFRNRTTSERQAALRGLADDTGGLPIVNTNDIDGHVQKMVAATSAYYLVGYSSTNTALDGRFRRISVKVTRPNIQVRARPGYVALPPLESRSMPVIDTRSAPAPVDIAMRALTASRDNALYIRSAAWTRSNSSGTPSTALWIVGELDPQLRHQREPSGWTGELTLRPVRGGPSTGQTISRPVTVPPGGSTFAFEWQESDGPLGAGEYAVQLQLTDSNGEPVGEFGRVTVPDALSALGDAVLLRRGVTTAQRYRRTADLRFQRTDRLRLELPTDTAGSASATLRDRRGAELEMPIQVSDRPDESGAFRWIVVDVPLISLAPADYAVEVVHGGVSRMTAFRLTP